MKKYLWLILALCCLGWFLTVQPLKAAPAADWKLVARVNGKVEGFLHQKQAWQTIWQAILMQDGDKARTYKDSRAKIVFADDSSVIIGENALVEIDKFDYKPQTRKIEIKLLLGKIRAQVGKFLGKDSSFEVITPNGVLSARGTEFFVEQQEEMDVTSAHRLKAGEDELFAASPGQMGSTLVRVFSGTVWANTPLGNFPILAGQSAQLTGGGHFQLNPGNFPPLGPRNIGSGTGTSGTGTGGTSGNADPDLDLQLPSALTNTSPLPPTSPLGIQSGSGNQAPPVEPGNGGIQPPNPSGSGNLQIIVNPPAGNQPVIIH